MADRLLGRRQQIDVLINNAGIFKDVRELTGDGVECMFATNHLGPFLLTNLLLDQLRASAPARVVTVSAPSTTRLDFDDLQGERRFRPLFAFGASKMANLLFTFELATLLEGTGVTANAVHPGIARTGLMRDAVVPIRVLTRMLGGSPEAAAARVIEAATSPRLADVTGQLRKGHAPVKTAAYARDIDVRQRLWKVSERLTGLDAQATAS